MALIEPIDFMVFDFVPRHKYPHLDPESADIVTQFILDYSKIYLYAAYDIPVGISGIEKNKENDPIMRDWLHLTAKRIDALFWNTKELLITEVKPKLNLHAIGQVLGYYELFREKYKTQLELIPTILFAQDDADVRKIARSHQIKLIQVEV